MLDAMHLQHFDESFLGGHLHGATLLHLSGHQGRLAAIYPRAPRRP
jgi:hypothetical protein